jgi:hypothetical protein
MNDLKLFTEGEHAITGPAYTSKKADAVSGDCLNVEVNRLDDAVRPVFIEG